MTKECETCPFRYWPAFCYASKIRSPRLCTLVETSPAYRKLVTDQTIKPDPKAIAGPMLMTRLKAVRACLYRTAPDCGCPEQEGECSHPDRPLKVTLADCANCLVFPLIRS